ncbi:hypothetical protein C4A77_02050 [Brevibacillus laterosporus]|uniref:Uncharacterized protein n=1 Tax=Brevibacillus laterosporus TaxID=1465 RepID=A0AAP8QHA5_BRELA|nr:hypothetical protein C4A77_02050 [Brevibacillus laterosporus]
MRGPVQFTFSQSVEPIFVKEITIIRQSVTREGEDKQRTLGKKYYPLCFISDEWLHFSSFC